jgi:FkbM family methyltransferase
MNGLVNFAWKLGIRAYRLARRANISSSLEPAFVKLASLVPATTHATAATLADGATLWMPPGYRDTRTVTTGLFQRDESRLFERLAQPGTTFLDVGAYVGYFTILASRLVGAQGRVYAFEPDTFAFEYLTRNIEANGCVNAVAINKGVADKARSATLIRDPSGPESFLTDAPTQGHSVIETVSLDLFFETEDWPQLHVVKMNIEGSELDALRGMKEVSRRNPALQLVMEFNPSAMGRAGVSRKDLHETLVDLGFRRGRLVERALQELPDDELLPKGSTVYNILLTK